VSAGATADYADQGFLAELKTCGGCKVVSTIMVAPPDGPDGTYAQKFAAALVANPAVNAVLVPFDTFLIYGNVPAAVAGTGRKISIVGGEGLAAGISFLKAGRVSAEFGFSGGWLGWGAMDTINRVLNGQGAVPEGIGWQTLDSTHLPSGTGAYTPSYDYEAGYLKLWGKS
jgi:ribose transport system substrate-binding protein